MSLLDSKIRRVKAQRACLNHAVALTHAMSGPILELGLGNGRTYDHLRQLLTMEGLGREIFVFEREVAAHPDCIPGWDHLFQGDFREALGLALVRLGPVAVLAHADFGSADEEATATTARSLARALPPLLAPGALVVSDQDISFAEAERLPLPPDVESGRYFLWQLPHAMQIETPADTAVVPETSRVDSFIHRMEAQHSCLNLAAELVDSLDGPVLELGLGNARTYDHLRDLFPRREFFVFDQRLRPLPKGVLDRKHLILGDIRDTLPAAIRRFGHRVILVHSDMGSGQKGPNIRLAAFIASQLPNLMQPGGLVVADQDVTFERATRMSLPDDVAPGRYFMYRAG